TWIDREIGRPQTTARNFRGHDRDRLRIAYLSADFRLHATTMLITELFELHDRSRFEVVAISFGPDDRSDVRSRIVKAVDRFHDIDAQSDPEAAKSIRDLGVDIAIDLKGHTRYARLGILAHRPAPIQTSFLGYPGTTGADFIDYVIADPTVLPFADQPFYAEKIVQLPDCYQVNDRKRAMTPCSPSRRELSLPEQAFVFCCFNDAAKITAEIFNLWMRLLDRSPGSVLWLLAGNDAAMANLRREAGRRGIAPERL